jgi:hypothetical protein
VKIGLIPGPGTGGAARRTDVSDQTRSTPTYVFAGMRTIGICFVRLSKRAPLAAGQRLGRPACPTWEPIRAVPVIDLSLSPRCADGRPAGCRHRPPAPSMPPSVAMTTTCSGSIVRSTAGTAGQHRLQVHSSWARATELQSGHRGRPVRWQRGLSMEPLTNSDLFSGRYALAEASMAARRAQDVGVGTARAAGLHRG